MSLSSKTNLITQSLTFKKIVIENIRLGIPFRNLKFIVLVSLMNSLLFLSSSTNMNINLCLHQILPHLLSITKNSMYTQKKKKSSNHVSDNMQNQECKSLEPTPHTPNIHTEVGSTHPEHQEEERQQCTKHPIE